MNDISVKVDDFKDANEAFENQVEGSNNEEGKTEPVTKTMNIMQTFYPAV
jgi:hypothetical protein